MPCYFAADIQYGHVLHSKIIPAFIPQFHIILQTFMRHTYCLLVLFTLLLLYSCTGKDKSDPVVTGALKITSLKATMDTVMAWDTTKISVITNLPATHIKWEADHGTLIGSGATITYYAGMCCIGTNTIKCRVEGDEGIDTASLRIHITPYIP